MNSETGSKDTNGRGPAGDEVGLRGSAKSSRPCKFCDEPISIIARVCHHCGRPQAIWKIHHLELTSLVNALVALGLLVLGAFQYQEAKTDRIKAEEASKKATKVASSIEELAIKQKATSVKINQTFSRLFSEICDAFDGVFDVNDFTCSLPNGKKLKYSPAADLLSSEAPK